MEIRELIKQSLAALPQLAAESDSKQIKADIDMLLGVTLRLTAELANQPDQGCRAAGRGIMPGGWMPKARITFC